MNQEGNRYLSGTIGEHMLRKEQLTDLGLQESVVNIMVDSYRKTLGPVFREQRIRDDGRLRNAWAWTQYF